jgi:hypothetical protein
MRSAEEWLKLPEISVPTLRSDSESGSILTVVKVGFLAVSESDCKRLNVVAPSGLGGKCILPTAVISANGTAELHRIPVELGPWVFDSVALAQAGRMLFPSTVEFGKLNGRVYAQHVP